jgi:hypothetical protein
MKFLHFIWKAKFKFKVLNHIFHNRINLHLHYIMKSMINIIDPKSYFNKLINQQYA